MFLFRKEKDIVSQKCIDCKCARCRYLEEGVCKYKYNQCSGKETKTCKMITCSEYKK